LTGRNRRSSCGTGGGSPSRPGHGLSQSHARRDGNRPARLSSTQVGMRHFGAGAALVRRPALGGRGGVGSGMPILMSRFGRRRGRSLRGAAHGVWRRCRQATARRARRGTGERRPCPADHLGALRGSRRRRVGAGGAPGFVRDSGALPSACGGRGSEPGLPCRGACCGVPGVRSGLARIFVDRRRRGSRPAAAGRIRAAGRPALREGRRARRRHGLPRRVPAVEALAAPGDRLASKGRMDLLPKVGIRKHVRQRHGITPS